MYNGWTPSVDRKTQIANHFASVRQLIKDNPSSQYWRDELERIKTEYEQHPADEAQQIERALSADSDMVAETKRDLNWVGTGSELKFGNVIFDLDAMGENARQRSAELKKRIDQRRADAQARRKADEIRALGGEA